MIKRGDKVKGFRFETSSGVRWNALMEPFVGVEGIVRQARPKMNELVIGFIGTPIHLDTLRVMPAEPYMQHWIYPLDEYLVLQREEKLKEIGINI
jgi:hypothetical protein